MRVKKEQQKQRYGKAAKKEQEPDAQTATQRRKHGNTEKKVSNRPKQRNKQTDGKQNSHRPRQKKQTTEVGGRRV